MVARRLSATASTSVGLSLLDMLEKKSAREFLEFVQQPSPSLEVSLEACLEFPVYALAMEMCFEAQADLLALLDQLPTIGAAVERLAAQPVPPCGSLSAVPDLDSAGAAAIVDFFKASVSAGLKLCITGGKPAEWLMKVYTAIAGDGEEPKLCLASAELGVLYRQVRWCTTGACTMDAAGVFTVHAGMPPKCPSACHTRTPASLLVRTP